MADITVLTLPANPIVTVGDFHVNNSVLSTFVVSMIVIVFAIYLRRNLKLIPGRLQVAMEGIVQFFIEQLNAAWGDEKRGKQLLPLIITLFLFILIANQFSIIPLVASIMTEGVQVLRTPTSDLTLPLTMGVSVVVGSHIVAFSRHPLRHIGNFIKFHHLLKVRSVSGFFNALLEIVLGVLDIVGEFAKILSMSCRLFGNIFAGEVMIAVITGLVAYFVPMPFMFLSIFSGIVQAFVFTILSINFMAGIIKSSEPAPRQAAA